MKRKSYSLEAAAPVLKTDLLLIDTHNHLHGGRGFSKDYEGAAREAVREMDALGIDKMIVMPPPFSPGHRAAYDIEDLLPVVRQYPSRFACLGGGGSLNIMIHETRGDSGLSSLLPPDLARQICVENPKEIFNLK